MLPLPAELLVNRIVRQFMELFGCKGLKGVLPCMNKVGPRRPCLQLQPPWVYYLLPHPLHAASSGPLHVTFVCHGCNSIVRLLPSFQATSHCSHPPAAQLYLSHTEAQTCLKSLRAALGLDPGASLEALANRVAALLDTRCSVAGVVVWGCHLKGLGRS